MGSEMCIRDRGFLGRLCNSGSGAQSDAIHRCGDALGASGDGSDCVIDDGDGIARSIDQSNSCHGRGKADAAC